MPLRQAASASPAHGVDQAGDLLTIGVHCRQHQRPAVLAVGLQR